MTNPLTMEDVYLDIHDMMKEGILTDCVLESNGATFTAHRVILAARSDYFKTAFLGDFQENGTRTIDLSNAIDDITLSLVLDFIYLGKVDWKGKYRLRVAHAADYLNIPALKTRCAQAIEGGLSTDECFAELQNSEDIPMIPLKENVIDMCSVTICIVSSSVVMDLGKESFQSILGRVTGDRYSINGWDDLPDLRRRLQSLLVDWMMHDSTNRLDNLVELVSQLEFPDD